LSELANAKKKANENIDKLSKAIAGSGKKLKKNFRGNAVVVKRLKEDADGAVSNVRLYDITAKRRIVENFNFAKRSIENKLRTASSKPSYMSRKDMRKVGGIARECLASPGSESRSKWRDEVGDIFFGKANAFTDKRNKELDSYRKNQTLSSLQNTGNVFAKITKDREKALISIKCSILGKLNKVREVLKKNASLRSMKGIVNKVYEFHCFETLRIEKGNQAFVEGERFKFKLEEFAKRGVIGKEKLDDLKKAYDKAKGKVDDMTKMVMEKAKKVKKSTKSVKKSTKSTVRMKKRTGFVAAVDISMTKFKSWMMYISTGLYDHLEMVKKDRRAFLQLNKRYSQ
ncbi:MAG: hypothetical protein LBI95_00140, partial [Holosporales bacterium]|nr:hypothetical protein [Holosporales bacterium]